MELQTFVISGYCRKLFIGLIIALVITTGLPAQQTWAQTEADADASTKVFLAVVGYEPVVAANAPCQTTQQALEFANLMKTDPKQGRPALYCNQILSDVAQARAQDMADRDYFGHVDPDGYGPNYHVRTAGYPLAKSYSQANNANNIESISAGLPTVAEAWASFIASDKHRRHLLAEEKFYADQVDYGIGYVYKENSTYKHYWVIITAKQATATE